ncbi:fused MFS/spermidine synthase [Shewanella sp. YIC-542]|uniref:fused MFS/spermidine synthase n=1 Tax=Shewanella mytili TaxID=3377111 RepID=UPI00398F0420
MSDYRTLTSVADAWGEISVLENAEQRILAFGAHDEQSKLLKATPHIPKHTYLRAMLLALLFTRPRSVMVLGLGGGVLVHALRQFDAASRITVVELRPAVIALCKQYFRLPLSKKLTVIEADALAYLGSAQHKRVDMLFCDLFDCDGIADGALSADFLQQCRQQLKADGVLVLNCWKEHSRDPELLARLQQLFPAVYACLTGSGNWVVFATAQPLMAGQAELKRQAAALSQRLGFELQLSLTRFSPWESI